MNGVKFPRIEKKIKRSKVKKGVIFPNKIG